MSKKYINITHINARIWNSLSVDHSDIFPGWESKSRPATPNKVFVTAPNGSLFITTQQLEKFYQDTVLVYAYKLLAEYFGIGIVALVIFQQASCYNRTDNFHRTSPLIR